MYSLGEPPQQVQSQQATEACSGRGSGGMCCLRKGSKPEANQGGWFIALFSTSARTEQNKYLNSNPASIKALRLQISFLVHSFIYSCPRNTDELKSDIVTDYEHGKQAF